MEDMGYRIGEVSAIHGIPIKTLRYYDELGIFKPAYTDPETNYRYYAREQFERLRLIKYMKGVGLSLAEIGENLAALSADTYVETLERQCAHLEGQIKRAQSSLHILSRRVAEIKAARAAPQGQVLLRQEPGVDIIVFPCDISCKNDLELAVARIQRELGREIKVGRFGQIVSHESLEAGDFLHFSGIYLYAEENPKYAHRASRIPEGLTATIYYSRKTDESIPYWEQLLAEVAAAGYRPGGHAYRTVVLESGIGIENEDYLARITLPVVEKDRGVRPHAACRQKTLGALPPNPRQLF